MSYAPQTVFRGTDAEVHHEGKWLTNATSVEASVEINQAELNLLGQHWTHHRNMGASGSGTVSGVFVNTELLEKASVMAQGREFRTELVIKNRNPDTGQTYRVRLKNVQFTTIPLANFQAGEVAEQEWPFTFADYEILDKVK